MPLLLEDRDLGEELSGVRSALIVLCRFCPASSLALRTKSPYLKLFTRFLRTPAYESSIRALKFPWSSRASGPRCSTASVPTI